MKGRGKSLPKNLLSNFLAFRSSILGRPAAEGRRQFSNGSDWLKILSEKWCTDAKT